MPSSLSTRRFINQELLPLYPGAYNTCRPVNLAPSTTFAAGTVLGITGVAANDVQTLTTTGTPTGGTQIVNFVDPISGASIPITIDYNTAAATAQTAARAAIGNSDVAVTGGPQPGSTLVWTFTGRYASMPVALMTTTITGLTGGTPASSFAHTTQGRTASTYGAYVGAGATDPAKCILRHAVTTDGSGNVSYGAQAYSGEGQVCPDAPAYFHGVFLCADLTGLDAGAVVDLGGKLESGSVTTGVLYF